LKQKICLNDVLTFFSDVLGNHEVSISAQSNHFSEALSTPFAVENDGHFIKKVPLTHQSSVKHGDVMTLTTQVRSSPEHPITGTAIAMGPEGFAVVADIDDTIKDTQVIRYAKMFRRAFISEYQPCPGMDAYFRLLHRQSAQTSFHYLSGSPFWVLPALQSFLKDSDFPVGQVQLAKFRFKDPETLIRIPQYVDFKRVNVRKLMKDFPRRKFLLYGDSGQNDAGAYAGVLREEMKEAEEQGREPRIQCIFIRLVTGVDADLEKKINVYSRFKKEFAKYNIPKKHWRIYYHPDQLKTIDLASGACHPNGERVHDDMNEAEGEGGWVLHRSKSGLVTGAERSPEFERRLRKGGNE